MSTLYSGRFGASNTEAIRRLNDSLPFDRRLWREDIEGSIAHATMLGECGVIPGDDADRIVTGLSLILSDLEKGAGSLPEGAEDIHTAVETMLKDRIGEVAGKLHTARSRNDQVATDLRLHVRHAIDRTLGLLRGFQGTLVTLAEREKDVVMPGYTHLQHAQPVRLAHHLLAYFWMLQRDVERLEDARKRVNLLPLGSGALAGTGFPINRERVASLLGFEGLCPNSLDAVSDRDFALEVLGALSILAVHLSRLGEEIVLWNSLEFGFLELDDAVATGSSMMPQKKNPDVAELARGKAGRIIGHLVALLTTMKGLPLSYNKDMQEDKEGLFDALDTVALLLPALDETLKTATFRADRMAAGCEGDFSTATDLADALVRQGIPFRDAHGIVAKLVRDCLERGRTLEDVTDAELAALKPGVRWPTRSAKTSVDLRGSEGGPSHASVLAQIAAAKEALEA